MISFQGNILGYPMSVEPLKVAASFVDVNVVYLIPPAHVQFFENALGLKFENQAMLYQTWKEKGKFTILV